MMAGLNLHQRLAAARQDAGYYIAKDSQAHAYTYASHKAVLSKAAPILDRHGVIVTTSLASVDTSQTLTTKRGDVERVAVVVLELTAANADDPTDRITVQVASEGSDPRDKAINKAVTAAQRVGYQQLLCLPSGDDPEADVAADRAMAEHRQAAAAEDARRKRLQSEAVRRAKVWAEGQEAAEYETVGQAVTAWVGAMGLDMGADGKLSPAGWDALETLTLSAA